MLVKNAENREQLEFVSLENMVAKIATPAPSARSLSTTLPEF